MVSNSLAFSSSCTPGWFPGALLRPELVSFNGRMGLNSSSQWFQMVRCFQTLEDIQLLDGFHLQQLNYQQHLDDLLQLDVLQQLRCFL
jgi:hypothetical protein